MTKAKSKTENKKTVKETKPKQTEKIKTKSTTTKTAKTTTKSVTTTKTKTKTTKPKEIKPKPTTRKKAKEEKINFVVSEHILVPRHEIVPESEVPSILKEFNLESKKQLPKILSNDVVIKEIGGKVGNVIRIHRKEPTGDCLYYRVVV